MRFQHILLFFLIQLLVFCTDNKSEAKPLLNDKTMLIRLSELEIDPEYLQEYLTILKEESAASVKLEPGVISIYPMFQKENPNQIRILEIYKDKDAYESHLLTPHFKKYKTTTLSMVKSLKLIDMNAIDGHSMSLIFKKLNN